MIARLPQISRVAGLFRRPARDPRFAGLPTAYARGLARLLIEPTYAPQDARDEALLALTAQQLRGAGAPPAFADLSREELTSVERIYAATTFDEPGYTAFRARLPEAERAACDDLRATVATPGVEEDRFAERLRRIAGGQRISDRPDGEPSAAVAVEPQTSDKVHDGAPETRASAAA